MQPIPILIIADSMALGGTESVAVNMANDLSEDPRFKIFLMSGRSEGELVNRIKPSVNYFFLNKKRQLDLAALWRLHRFINKNKIQIVHAHSTSMYFPVLIKWMHRFKLVWHDHFGLVLPPSGKRFYPYISFSRWFDFAIAVNQKLLASNIKHLHVKKENQTFLPNYSVAINSPEPPHLIGEKETRIVCLANLRPQKDHLNLLAGFKMVLDKIPSASLYCVGICVGDDYEEKLRNFVAENNLQQQVVFTDATENPFQYLLHSGLAVLSSESEGMPLSLIEYGLAGLPVVCTNVGQCSELLLNGENGLLVPPHDSAALCHAMIDLLQHPEKAKKFAEKFNAFALENYSKKSFIKKLTDIYLKLLGQ